MNLADAMKICKKYSKTNAVTIFADHSPGKMLITAAFTAHAQKTVHANAVKSVCVRTINEIVESDTAEAVMHIIVNGYVKIVDLSTGHENKGVIAAVLTSKQRFVGHRLESSNAPYCFEALGGRGTSRPFPCLVARCPIQAVISRLRMN